MSRAASTPGSAQGGYDLELSGVRKTFGRTVAVDGLDLVVGRGEFVALLGPSGCGKTTTLWMIAGFQRPDAGEIRIKERTITDYPPYRRDVGIVFQNYALFPHMTVFDNVAYGLRRRKIDRPSIVARVGEVLHMVGLSGLEHRYPRQLSGGQQQRAAVARAIVIQPSVLLFDEPLSNLDAKLRQEMRSELRKLQRQLKIATIFVTHDQDEAFTMADRILVMNAGRVEQVGTPEDIYRRPGTRFVATFIGECNFLPGQISRVDAGLARFTAGGVSIDVPVPERREQVAVGITGMLTLRPEDIRVLPDGAPAPGGANVVGGCVVEVIYLGASCHYRVALDDGPELLIYQQGMQRATVAEGASVRVAWDAAAGSFRPDQPSA